MSKWTCNAYLNFLEDVIAVSKVSRILTDFIKLCLRKAVQINALFSVTEGGQFSHFLGYGIIIRFLFSWNSLLKRLNISWGSGRYFTTHCFYLLLIFFSSRFSIWFFFIISISLLIFSICSDLVLLVPFNYKHI